MSPSVCLRRALLMLCTVAVSANVIQAFTIDENAGRPSIVSGPTADDANPRPSLEEYLSQRQKLKNEEFEASFESDVQLTDVEEEANEIIMRAKNKELNRGLADPSSFNPARHIFEVLQEVKESDLFKILKKMPKGGILHAHDTALCSADYLVSLTYWEHLWQCAENGSIVSLYFSREQPKPDPLLNCVWTSVAEERERRGAAEYDAALRKSFTLFDKDVNPKLQYSDINAVWKVMMDIFGRITPLLGYVPVWQAYYKNGLKEMFADNVQYLEFRGTLPPVYDLDGRNYNEEEIMGLYAETLEEFKKENPDFIGSKFVYAPVKNFISNDTSYLTNIPKLYASYPNFLAGFDLVGQEDTSPMIIDFVDKLLQVPKEINFYIHAGETNWFGSIDENLIDAVLLGAKRIGHGYGLIKHPKLMELVKQKDIAIEINPVSNQVLKLVEDYRNHPGTTLLSQNFPLVVSSDDPQFWEATPLTHDFYMAFLGMTPAPSDLRTLKKLAKNSIKYSALTDSEKTKALAKWQPKWDEFIANLIATERNDTGGSNE